ncbi:MAG: Barrel-sandwich domain of CusB or HlyD rane-fusion [Verrucomicrobiota bacterium]|jgi:multidrug resistance efflux pump
MLRAALFLVLLSATSGLSAVEIKGVIQPEEVPLRWQPQAFGGQVRVAERLVRAGEAASGAVILRLESAEADLALEEAKIGWERAVRHAAAQKEDLERLRRQSQLGLEQSALALEAANRDAAFWRLSGRADAAVDAELSQQRKLAELEEARDELRQLKAMYEKAGIDETTRDIVLNRAQRKLEGLERQLPGEKAKRDKIILTDLVLGDQRWELELQRAKMQDESTRIQTARNLQAATEAAADSDRRVLRSLLYFRQIEQDLANLTLRAPMKGHVMADGAAPQEVVDKGRPLIRFVRADRGSVSLAVPERLQSKLVPGSQVELRNSDTGEILQASVVSRSFGLRRDKEGLVCDVVFDVPLSERVRPGMELVLSLN